MPKFTKKLSRAKKCPLCEQGVVVDFKEVQLLKRYVSERGKILGRVRTGICAKHQRQITRGVKRARYVALLSFVQS
ncbi:30S ribosomal protein S18 [Candidatus Curtissbacteria bacterium RIFCSPLOWO2_01_FULL_41_18]|uniref:Small ribosomal subunit protein bS18 n=2 Tax=Candidatus Curtissiibacteriota TaxID=1752717 RepID=A0A1F5FZH9_9BACT|nr:MAG: 30S ribosomal protein S18 [Candidatus Curtissbacteria bacterium RIFCSPHIGHO2_01_FULL_41_13]OGE03616.1 MAG: 30S ribosomal protein S18 [Candidatus Curtissbacteria bacterium RIFCSPLOWO2_01_FULL_41_18]